MSPTNPSQENVNSIPEPIQSTPIQPTLPPIQSTSNISPLETKLSVPSRKISTMLIIIISVVVFVVLLLSVIGIIILTNNKTNTNSSTSSNSSSNKNLDDINYLKASGNAFNAIKVYSSKDISSVYSELGNQFSNISTFATSDTSKFTIETARINKSITDQISLLPTPSSNTMILDKDLKDYANLTKVRLKTFDEALTFFKYFSKLSVDIQDTSTRLKTSTDISYIKIVFKNTIQQSIQNLSSLQLTNPNLIKANNESIKFLNDLDNALTNFINSADSTGHYAPDALSKFTSSISTLLTPWETSLSDNLQIVSLFISQDSLNSASAFSMEYISIQTKLNVTDAPILNLGSSGITNTTTLVPLTVN